MSGLDIERIEVISEQSRVFWFSDGAGQETPDKEGYLVSVMVLLLGLILSPRYLVCSDPPRKSDIIILFPGPEFEAMKEKAGQLIKEGFSEYLCIPTSFSIYRVNDDRTALAAIRFPEIRPGIDLSQTRAENNINMAYFQKIRREGRFPRFYENTHVEMLLGKKVMDAYGFRKAIFVSSPSHMKRIKIMAGRVFDSAYDIKLVPTRIEKKLETTLPSLKDMQHVFREFPKIIWFLCYDLWDRRTGAISNEHDVSC